MAEATFAAMQSVLQLGSSQTRPRRQRKTFMCRHCGMTFKRGEHLSRHERSHTSERPFVCTVCDRGFTRKDLLVRHMRLCDGTRTRRKERRRTNIARVDVQPTADPADATKVPETSVASTGPQLIQNPEAAVITKDSPGSNSKWQDEMFLNLLDFSDVRNASMSEATSPSTSLMLSPSAASVPSDLIATPEGIEDLVTATASQFALNMHDWNFLDQFKFPDMFGSMQVDSGPNSPWMKFLDNEAVDTEKALDTTDEPEKSESEFKIVHIPKVRIVPFDDTIRDAMQMLLSELFPTRDVLIFDATTMCRYLSVYTTNFSRHFPCVHHMVFKFGALKEYYNDPSKYSRNQSDDNYPWEAMSMTALMLTCAAVGAVYSLVHKDARCLRNWARKTFGALPCEATMPDERKLMLVQARLLLTGFDAWSGEDAWTQEALDEQAFFIRYCVLGTKKKRDRVTTSWKDWIIRESCHRLYWGTFVVMSDYGITFHQFMPMRLTDVGILLPENESLWLAEDEQEWLSLLPKCAPPSSIDAVLTSIMNDPSCRINEVTEDESETASVSSAVTASSDSTRVIMINNQPHELSLYSVYLIMHVIMNHIWTADEVLHLGMMPYAPRVQELNKLRIFAFQQAERILTQSASNLMHTQDDFIRSANLTVMSPMIFNAISLVRVMQIRLFKTSRALNALLCDPNLHSGLDSALDEFLDTKPEMGQLVDKALDDAVVGLEVQVRAGPAMIKRLAPVYWNIENALCGWDSNLFLSRWLHEIEMRASMSNYIPTSSERVILLRIQALLRDAGILREDVICEVGGAVPFAFRSSLSLAAAVVEFCSDLLDDTWVWGVAVKMAEVLRALGERYRMGNLQCRVMTYQY